MLANVAYTQHRDVYGLVMTEHRITSLAILALSVLVEFHTSYPELNNSAIKILMPIKGTHTD